MRSTEADRHAELMRIIAGRARRVRLISLTIGAFAAVMIAGGVCFGSRSIQEAVFGGAQPGGLKFAVTVGLATGLAIANGLAPLLMYARRAAWRTELVRDLDVSPELVDEALAIFR